MSPARRFILAAMAFLALSQTLSAQQGGGQESADSLVRLISAQSAELIETDGHKFRKVTGPARFLHNNAYLICDTALWNVDEHVIHAWGNVMLLQEETVLTSDKLDYLVDEDLAQFRGTLVELTDADKNTLRTRFLDYNTKDSVGVFSNGASMRDKDGQIIESLDGTYDTKTNVFTFEHEVNMFTDSVFVKTPSLVYESDPQKATFLDGVDAWQDDKMLSAREGYYDRSAETFTFFREVHVMSEKQEGWADTVYVQQSVGDVKMYSDAQIFDSSRSVWAVGDYIHYMDSVSTVVIERNAAVVAATKEGDKPDTLYMGGDMLQYWTVPMYELGDDASKASQQRLSDMNVDPVTEYRRQAAKAAADAAASSDPDAALKGGRDDDDAMPGGGKGAGDRVGGKSSGRKHITFQGLLRQFREWREAQRIKRDERRAERAAARDASLAAGDDGIAVSDSLSVSSDSLSVAIDSLALADSLVLRDSLSLSDSLAKADSLALSDSLALRDSLSSADVPAARDSTRLSSDEEAVIDADDEDDSPADEDSPAVTDSVVVVLDSTKVGFVRAVGSVKVFRSTMQAVCDSLEYCELDSLARLYRDPLIWNENRHQYRSDSVILQIKDGRMQKANLASNAFVIIQEDSVIFDQIRGVEMMAYFDEAGQLARYDVLGGAAALFFLQENDAWATANKAESKMLSVNFVDGVLDRVHYYDSPHNDAYPTVQLPSDISRMKGFSWQPELRPRGPEDITQIRPKDSERERYAAVPRSEFKQTDRFFPGYMKSVYDGIARRDSLRKVRAAQRDSLAAVRRLDDTDSLALGDSLSVRDSLAMADSLAVADSLALGDSLAVRDSLLAAGDSLAVKDSLQIAPVLSEKEIKAAEREAEKARRKAEAEAKRKARIDAREKRWAEQDAKDAAKAAAKAEAAAERKRQKNYKALLKIKEQEARDEAKLQKYIARYRKKYGLPDPEAE